MRRAILIGSALVAVLLAIGVYVLLHSLDSIVETAIERIGSRVTGVEVRLDSVKIHLAGGEGTLRGLVVGNPEGFETAEAIRVGRIRLVLDTGTVAKDPIVVKEIRIEEPSVTYEVQERGSNFDAIRGNIDASLGGAEGVVPTSGTGEAGAPAEEGGGRRLVVDHLRVTGGEVRVSSIGLQGQTLRAPLPDIHLEGIGRESGGVSAPELARRILGSITRSSGKAVARLDLGALTESLAKGRKGATRALGESAGAALQQGAGEAGKTLRKLFK